MRLYILRHGIAEDLSSSDFARELTPRGIKRMRRAARVMRRMRVKPAAIFSSPRLRARQTAEIVAAELGMSVTISDRVDFGFDLDDIKALTGDLRANDEVMFVGHNPDMSLVTQELTGCDLSMKKGGLARVDAPGGNLDRGGELVWLIAPRAFDAMAAQATADDDQTHKKADTSAPVLPLIARRWSPVGFDPTRLIDAATLRSILEAGRWAASSYNLQPWRFIVARRQDEAAFGKMLDLLREGNQTWAGKAAVLMICAAHKHGRGDAINRHASHDLGQALAQMSLQALRFDIYTHQMAGFYPDKSREAYGIPEAYEPFTAAAFGYRVADASQLSDAHQQRDSSLRQRQPLPELVFGDAWSEPASFLE